MIRKYQILWQSQTDDKINIAIFINRFIASVLLFHLSVCIVHTYNRNGCWKMWHKNLGYAACHGLWMQVLPRDIKKRDLGHLPWCGHKVGIAVLCDVQCFGNLCILNAPNNLAESFYGHNVFPTICRTIKLNTLIGHVDSIAKDVSIWIERSSPIFGGTVALHLNTGNDPAPAGYGITVPTKARLPMESTVSGIVTNRWNSLFSKALPYIMRKPSRILPKFGMLAQYTAIQGIDSVVFHLI